MSEGPFPPTKEELATAYCQGLYAEPPLLAEISGFLQQQRHAIQVRPLIGQLIKVLVAACAPKKILEIGTLAGYSALCFAHNLPKEGHIWTIEKEEKNAQWAANFFEKAHQSHIITCLPGAAVDILPTLEAYGPFDMIFIDANKAAYPLYLEWSRRNLRKGGLMLADNTLLGGAVYGHPRKKKSLASTDAMRQFNQQLAQSKDFESVCLPLDDGFSLGVKR